MSAGLKIVAGTLGITGVSGATYLGIRELTKEDITPHLVSSKLEKGILNTKGDDSLWISRNTELGSYDNPVDKELKTIKGITSPENERKNKLIKWCEQKYQKDYRKLEKSIFEEVQKFCTKKISEQITGKTAISGEVSSGSSNWNAPWNKLKGVDVKENSLVGEFKKARTDHSSKSGTEGATALKAACEKNKKSPYLNENDLLFKNVTDYCYT